MRTHSTQIFRIAVTCTHTHTHTYSTSTLVYNQSKIQLKLRKIRFACKIHHSNKAIINADTTTVTNKCIKLYIHIYVYTNTYSNNINMSCTHNITAITKLKPKSFLCAACKAHKYVCGGAN